MRKLTVIGVILSSFFIILAFKNFNLNDFTSAMVKVNIFLVFLAAGAFLCSYILRGIRWQIMLKSVKEIPFLTSFCILFIGYMANALLPLRLGEVIRAYVLGVKENISKLASLSSIILERIFDGMILVFFLSMLLIIYPFPGWVKNLGIFTAVLFCGGISLIFMITRYQIKIINFLCYILHFFSDTVHKKITPYIEKFVLGVGMLKNKSQSSFVAVISVFIWLNEALVYYILLIAFNITSQTLFFIALFTMIIINFGIMIPSSPGNIGTYHYFCILALTLFGVSSNTALAYAIVANALMIICTVISGVICMWHMEFSISFLKDEINKFW
jgi:hypothetical protein